VKSETCGRREFLARSLGFVLGAGVLVRSLPAQAARADVRTTVDQNNAILVDSTPFFPIISWMAGSADIPLNLALGVNTFMGTSASDESAFAQSLARAGAYYIPSYDPARTIDLPNTLGYYLEDEPDGHGHAPSALPQTQRVGTTGKLIFQTFSNHFWPHGADPSVGSKAVYPQYFANTDVIGTDVYPYAKFCGNQKITIASVFDIQQSLVQQAGEKPTFQWIEATALGGLCADPGNPQLSPARVRAEIWDAIAGGAKGLGLFTWANQGGNWGSFVVAPEIQQQIKSETGRVAALSAVLLSPAVQVQMRPQTPLRASARTYGGRTYVIAVNNSSSPLTTSFGVSGLQAASIDVWQEDRALKVRRGGMSDRFDPYGVHIYVA
jgi:hypothetical protein